MFGFVPETSYVLPWVAASLSRFRPGEVVNLATSSGLPGDPAPVRSARVGDRFTVHLADVLLLSAVSTPVPHDGGDLP